MSSSVSDTSLLRISGLGGIFTMNRLFTVALFIALALNSGNTFNYTESSYAKNVVTFHVYSFTFFLLSTLMEPLLKLVAVQISKSPSDLPIPKSLRILMLVPSVGSACGVVFMTLGLINVVEMKLGTCSSVHSVAAIVPLMLLVPMAPIIYLFPAVYAFTSY